MAQSKPMRYRKGNYVKFNLLNKEKLCVWGGETERGVENEGIYTRLHTQRKRLREREIRFIYNVREEL